jgi:tRNA wybutosine-synthesizing protein 3
MDSFTVFKRSVLNRKDKSNKGSIDKEIIPLTSLINKNNDYCTTSSCSGRIVLIIEPKSNRKKDFRFLYETHEILKIKKMRKALKKLPTETVWFRFEPLILHVACSTTESAQDLLTQAQRFFKHSGIMTLKKRPILQVRGSEFLETPIAHNGKLTTSESYLKLLIKEANSKLKKNKERIKRFENDLRQRGSQS